jgi:hypothetical protein
LPGRIILSTSPEFNSPRDIPISDWDGSPLEEGADPKTTEELITIDLAQWIFTGTPAGGFQD